MTAAARELAALRRLAGLYGVQTAYLDGERRRVEAKPESLVAALRGLGAPIDTVAGARAALGQAAEEAWCWHIEPVLVAWDGVLDSLELRLPSDAVGGIYDADLALEDGGFLTRRIRAYNASISSSANLQGREYAAIALPLRWRLPSGYHRLTLRSNGRDLRSLVISAPIRAYPSPPGKHWGFFLPLYALHSKRSWGIGDFTDLDALIEWAAGQGAGFVGTLPLLSSFLGEEPYAPSPYEPVSRLFWNEIFIDIESAVTAAARKLSEDVPVPAATAKAARRLNAREAVPYREVMALKRRVLTDLTRRKNQDPAANEAAMRSSAARPALRDYAAFRAALETLGPRWREWPSPQRSGSLSPSDYKAETADYYVLAQIAAEGQMSRLRELSHQHGVRLYLDLPVGVHPDGYDAWRFQDLFAQGMTVGAPPDLLAPDGQNWGFQPLNRVRLRSQGYEYMRAYLRQHMEAAGLLRIDHAIGLHRLFWIPEGGSGADGVFVKQPSEELYAMLSLESHLAESVVVGENLGLVPPEVNRGMARHGIGDMYVQTFAMTGDARRPFRAPHRESIASFGTHDLAPFAAFWTDQDLVLRRDIGVMGQEAAEAIRASRDRGKRAVWEHLLGKEEVDEQASVTEVYRGTAELLAKGPARWVTLSLEDTWGETRPQNVPGTVDSQHANWVRRARYGLEDFEKVDDITKTADLMRCVRGKPAVGHRRTDAASLPSPQPSPKGRGSSSQRKEGKVGNQS